MTEQSFYEEKIFTAQECFWYFFSSISFSQICDLSYLSNHKFRRRNKQSWSLTLYFKLYPSNTLEIFYLILSNVVKYILQILCLSISSACKIYIPNIFVQFFFNNLFYLSFKGHHRPAHLRCYPVPRDSLPEGRRWNTIRWALEATWHLARYQSGHGCGTIIRHRRRMHHSGSRRSPGPLHPIQKRWMPIRQVEMRVEDQEGLS